jgi:hypothetical protein
MFAASLHFEDNTAIVIEPTEAITGPVKISRSVPARTAKLLETGRSCWYAG